MHYENQSSRLFESDFWERFSHVHHNAPFFIYIPVIVACLLYGFLVKQISAAFLADFFTLGILQWTLFEYILHRLLFHYEPKSHWAKKILYVLHGVHHDHPNETDRLVMPPVTSIPLATAIFVVCFCVCGNFAFPLFSGFLTGYLYYEFVHFSVHNSNRKLGWTANQRKNHLRHHFQDPENRFGVTSPLWDYIFRTEK